MIQLPHFPMISLHPCIFLGGSRSSLVIGERYEVRLKDAFEIYSAKTEACRILFPEILNLKVYGPGAVTTGGGFVGGGFGVEGAVEGMAIAGVLNALTMKTKIVSYISVETLTGELHFLYSSIEPGALRVALAPVFTLLDRLDPQWFAVQEAKLDWCRKSGFIDEDTHAALHSALLNPPGLSKPTTGRCPRCEALVPMTSPKCTKCEATFGNGFLSVQPKPVF